LKKLLPFILLISAFAGLYYFTSPALSVHQDPFGPVQISKVALVDNCKWNEQMTNCTPTDYTTYVLKDGLMLSATGCSFRVGDYVSYEVSNYYNSLETQDIQLIDVPSGCHSITT
jgi:hypothetical protein